MDKSGVERRISARVSQGEFLANLLHLVSHDSDVVQTDFVRNLSRIALTLRRLLETNGLLRRLDYTPSAFWPSVKGNAYTFLDGGVASIDLPSAAPIGIRVGSYTVRPGDPSANREAFQIELALIDDLFSNTGVAYDSDFDDVAKMRDAARIVTELSAAYRVAKSAGAGGITSVFLHGPLINPVSPYGLDDFPSFSLEKSRFLLDDPAWDGSERDRNFVALYFELLDRLRTTGICVVGAVERSIGKEPVVIRSLLDALAESRKLTAASAQEIVADMRSYGFNDSSLLDVVLGAGEYVEPFAIDRQGPPNKWPDSWRTHIARYPKALTTYLKPSDLVTPFRVEGFEGTQNFRDALELIFNTSRLLPSYGFPVGLDIVDKFAKVPAWLSRGVKGQHSVVLLKRALESGDPAALNFAKRVLAAKGRDWFFRPGP